MATIYLLLTDTKSVLSTLIAKVTHEKYNHLSLSLDKDLEEVYSFGRLNPNNPFSGGFTREDTSSDFYSRASCQIYALKVSEEQYVKINKIIKEFQVNRFMYHYNLLGLIPAALNIPWNRPHSFFCSEFVSHVLIQADVLPIFYVPSIMRPQDVLIPLNGYLIYEGYIYNYINIIRGKRFIERLASKTYH